VPGRDLLRNFHPRAGHELLAELLIHSRSILRPTAAKAKRPVTLSRRTA
jgi:hypothetical protein